MNYWMDAITSGCLLAMPAMGVLLIFRVTRQLDFSTVVTFFWVSTYASDFLIRWSLPGMVMMVTVIGALVGICVFGVRRLTSAPLWLVGMMIWSLMPYLILVDSSGLLGEEPSYRKSSFLLSLFAVLGAGTFLHMIWYRIGLGLQMRMAAAGCCKKTGAPEAGALILGNMIGALAGMMLGLSSTGLAVLPAGGVFEVFAVVFLGRLLVEDNKRLGWMLVGVIFASCFLQIVHAIVIRMGLFLYMGVEPVFGLFLIGILGILRIVFPERCREWFNDRGEDLR